jgi:hypothetical protein
MLLLTRGRGGSRAGPWLRSLVRAGPPGVIRMDRRLPVLKNAARNHGATLGCGGQQIDRCAGVGKASLVMRAQSYRRRMFAEFDRVKELVLP